MPEPLYKDARQIWNAGVQAVTPSRLFRDKVHLDGQVLSFDHIEIQLSQVRRLIVVGAGKASAAMAVALHRSVLSRLPNVLPKLEVVGWINAPAGTFSDRDAAAVQPIHLHTARPAGANIPTQPAVEGTRRILEMVGNCDQRDVVLCLLSGGGSAVLVAPRAGITLADKQAVAQEIAAAGGNIEQLNAVRRALSDVKGGGLARACRAGRLITLIISDVIGDPLETIASGPTMLDASVAAADALKVLEQLDLVRSTRLANVVHSLEQYSLEQYSAPIAGPGASAENRKGCQVEHLILGNNADAIDAAGVKAVELGYHYIMQGARRGEGDVLEFASLATDAVEQLASQNQIDCWISGGEPTVRLPGSGAGRGGRNQQLALAILRELQARNSGLATPAAQPFVFLSGGTDGEDGPTNAAGAYIDNATFRIAESLQLDAADFLDRADAYTFFEQVGGLLISGPTGTNVCDLRVALSRPSRK